VQDTTLAGDVRHYLSQAPRQLPSRALYDTLGSLLFDAICELPWYPLTRAERRLLQMHRRAIFESAQQPRRLIELGPGNGSKLTQLLAEPSVSHHVRQVDLVDVSASALREAARRLQETFAGSIVTHEARYEDGLRKAASTDRTAGRKMVLFLGSNIGNFDLPGATTFLRGVCDTLGAGDALLIGADLVKPEHELQLAYDDPLGVTAAFNLNLLLHLNIALGATFDVAAFSHKAVWNATESRVEMHLVSRREQVVDIPAAGLSITLRKDETIWTESSYKYTPQAFEHLLNTAGLTAIQSWFDAEGRFLLVLAGAR
jgi:dimethylhistidine N-methyltransferase